MNKIKDTAVEYDTMIGVRNEKEAPASLANIFGLEDVPSTEESAWQELWKGMPEYKPAIEAKKSLTVNFRNQEDYDTFIKLVGFVHLTSKTKTIWYPELEKKDNFLTRFIDGE